MSEIATGGRLGAFEVKDLLGEGGMGRVWRARDTTLGRDVALKVLPDLFADDPERLARFQREAQLLAALNHPNIAGIHGIEDNASAGVRALVLELVEGPTLADRIAQGAMPVEDALRIARQIAQAIDAAHEQGIIHRDLKPANIKVKDDGTVKVLDFGLAKALGGDASGDPSQSPTLTAMTAQAGVIMGTAAYMAPEQARGKPVDKRADIWAFGAVLHEMLTGRRAFRGDEVSDILASVLAREPDAESLPPNLPGAVRRLLDRCLDKDPKRRLRDIGEAIVQIDDATAPQPTVTNDAGAATAAPPAVPSSRWRRLMPALASGLAAALVAGFGVWWATRPADPRVSRFVVTAPTAPLAAAAQATDLAISPDGTVVVYTSGSPRRLYVRSVDELEARVLTDTQRAQGPFFSPGGEWVGFYDPGDGALKKISIAGGRAVTLCAADSALRGASWGADDRLVFALNDTAGLRRVSAGGGEPEQLTTPDPQRGEGRHHWPEILPGGRAVLFAVASGAAASSKRIDLLSLETGQQTALIPIGSHPRYAPTGHIVYGTDGTLRAVPFDLDSLAVIGDPVPVVDGVVTKDIDGAANFGLAGDGSLVYVTGAGSSPATNTIVWVARDGTEEDLEAGPGAYSSVRVSPDGRQLALAFDGDVHTYDSERGTFNRVTTHPGTDQHPLWTVDGAHLVFESNRGGGPELFRTPADGSGTPDLVLALEGSRNLVAPEAWTPDGTTLLFVEARLPMVDIGALSMEGDPALELLIDDEFQEGGPAIAPDGRWLAYHSNRSGRYEVFVERFPELGGRQPISTDGGRVPRWSPDGTELFYQSLDGRQLLAVPITTGSTLTAGAPDVLFEGPYLASTGPSRPYDLDPDGERFAMIKVPAATAEDGRSQIVLVQNWDQELSERVPVP